MVLSGLKRSQFTDSTSLLSNIFDYVMIPCQATIFSMLAFYIASAAYRAFRVRTWLATVLLGTAFIVMLRIIPLPGPLDRLLAAPPQARPSGRSSSASASARSPTA